MPEITHLQTTGHPRPAVIVRFGGKDGLVSTGRLELERAPRTCAALLELLPLERDLLHVRWSGQAVWMPMDDVALELPPENATRHPLPGQGIAFADPVSESEILIAYGSTSFASVAGPLAGNHFLTLDADQVDLERIGRRALWEGAQPVRIELAS